MSNDNKDEFSNPFDKDTQFKSSSAFDDAGMSPVEDDHSGRTFVWLLLGVAAISCGVLFAAGFFFFKPDAQALVDKYFPSPTATFTRTPTSTPTITLTPTNTPTPTLTPSPTLSATPHVLITPAEGETVFEETFDTNERKWYAYYQDNTVLVEDGRLTLRSEESGYIGVAFCTTCPVFDDPFYFKAEVTTLNNTFEEYGLVFCSPGYGTNFYVFQMNARTQYFDLYKHSATGWEPLATARRSSNIRDFPATNTLAVYFDHGAISLYINDALVNSYKDDDPFMCRRAGFIVDEGKIDMIVDNIFAYKIQSTSTLSP
jgi:hypothetical protein